MEFTNLAEFGIIEASFKTLIIPLLASPYLKFIVNVQFAAGLFQIPDGFW